MGGFIVLTGGRVHCTDRWEGPLCRQVGESTVLTGGRVHCTDRWEGPHYYRYLTSITRHKSSHAINTLGTGLEVKY